MSFLFKRPPTLLRSARPCVRITETFGKQSSTQEKDPSQLVLDARQATTVSEGLTWLYQTCRHYASSTAFRRSGGRVVILRSEQQPSDPVEAVATSEAMVGFAKSLAKENGPRGATVNIIRDATATPSACNAPLEWLLSHHSCYVTGQELKVVRQINSGMNNYDDISGASLQGSGAVLITGAAGAIGASTASFFCQQQQFTEVSSSPMKLLLVDHPSTLPTLEQLAQDLVTTTSGSSTGPLYSDNSQPPEIQILPVDVTSPQTPLTIAKEGVRWGGWERVIHAAGITRDATLRNMDLESAWHAVLKVNLSSILAMDHTLLESSGALDDTASFVYFGSTSGIAGNAGQSNYAASKAAFMGYAKAMEEQNSDHFFRVVSPGFIATQMTDKMPWMVRQVAARLNALGQAGHPDDVAAAVAFLSSPAARSLEQGCHLRVCGLFLGGR